MGKGRRQLKKTDRRAQPFWQKVDLKVEIYDWVLLPNKNFGVFELCVLSLSYEL